MPKAPKTVLDKVLFAIRELKDFKQGPLTPTGGWTGVLVLKIPSQGWVFSFGQVATWTPQMYGLWTPLDELMSMVLFLSSFSFNFEI